ncbi:Vacuolar protease A [Friedmanniomyces endolithicus]|uniref:Vacuolar protease A n=1 Tax=Friedmanniomyces endolithicus TaxID=329885 RepID=A0AAN6K2P3_9PEZI|nr:Vacuolar protease A [Friedmanniomyces endolithicus]KAK0956470.1 Vacuolar protease A [Friedmanniomyces endolithicus]KAK0956744.1 Vacuolar protease A [Friedmanniomyces endolithicus]KAK1050601.1 Vacuolar protease A [Friedmanniomyces endolithicus]
MPDLHTLPAGSRPEKAIRNNGPADLAIERFKLCELAEGWPMYRDSCEWENLASIFAPNAYIYTSWTGKTPYQDFIAASKAGMDEGKFIMHRCLGVSTDISPEGDRAVTKMKAHVTQRFVLDGCEVDVDVDCRFCYFWEKGTDSVKDIAKGEWRARLVRHWYEKDKLIPVNPNKVPKLEEVELEKHPYGYRYLSYCWQTAYGSRLFDDLPGHRRDVENTVNGRAHDRLYMQCKTWVEGGSLEF